MNKWNLIIDVARCENCHNCSLATKDEYVGNDFPGYSAPQQLHGPEWIKIERKVRGEGAMVDVAYLVSMCNHCDNAPCVAASGGAIRKREDGIVLIDPVKARNRRELVKACPYGHIHWNDEQAVPQTWPFDAHLMDQGWDQPRCAHACPTGAIQAVKTSDAEMSSLAAREGLEVLRPEVRTKPRVYYKNLHRFNKCFIGGSVVVSVRGRDECVQGATAVLFKDGKELARQQSDVFGDFKFDRLPPESGQYSVTISHPDYGQSTVQAAVTESCCIGDIRLPGTSAA